ncbi:hypothetical protein LOTGIDRAFT_111743, partial [Lottia gigantea]
LCPAGGYCPAGSAIGIPCPFGKYSKSPGAKTEFDCIPCDPGFFCSGSSRDCSARYICLGGSSTPTPTDGITGSLCPEGQYCPKGTPAPIPCPLGTWSNSTGLGIAGECQQCTGGYYCASTGLKEPTGTCDARFYCSQGAVVSNPSDGVTGNSCTIGNYCPIGTAVPIPCADGTYMPNTGADECFNCTPGHYCVSQTTPEDCPPGYYCPEGTGECFLLSFFNLSLLVKNFFLNFLRMI